MKERYDEKEIESLFQLDEEGEEAYDPLLFDSEPLIIEWTWIDECWERIRELEAEELAKVEADRNGSASFFLHSVFCSP